VLITPATLKAYATGKGNGDKTAMAMAALKRADREFGDDNQCDAWWLRAAGLDWYGQPEFALPKVQRDREAALAKVRGRRDRRLSGGCRLLLPAGIPGGHRTHDRRLDPRQPRRRRPAAGGRRVNNLPAHGTYSRYIRHACRCGLCRDAGRKYRLRLGYDRVNGTRRRIDNTQPRVHVEQLVARGWTHEQIAAAAGLSAGSIHDLYTSRYKTITRASAEAILNVRLDQAPPIPRGLVDATGTRRRLQALMALGYTLPDIAGRVDVGVSSLQQTTNGRWTSIRSTTATKVERVYRQLSILPAPQSRFAEQARNQALNQGWYGPMAWADIDNPRCVPEPCEPPAPGHVHADDVTELAGRGFDDAEIGRRLGVSPRTVLRARTAHNIAAAVAS
jgi:hypothetical protein